MKLQVIMIACVATVGVVGCASGADATDSSGKTKQLLLVDETKQEVLVLRRKER